MAAAMSILILFCILYAVLVIGVILHGLNSSWPLVWIGAAVALWALMS
jgi:hypothetical protein